MRRVASAAVAVMSVAIAGPALAWGDGCGGHAVECYDKVRLPDVYATEARPVVVHPGYSEVVETPPVVINQPEKVLVSPGRWHEEHTSAVVGTRTERVLVSPASRTYEVVPAVTRTVAETVVVHPGGTSWEHSRRLFGHERMCKIQRDPVTQTVTREVLVAPARRVARDVPAVYQTVARPVVLQQASTRRVYEAPMYGTVMRPVVISPGSRRVVSHPPVVGVVHEQVLVRQGGYGWARSHGGGVLFDHQSGGGLFGRQGTSCGHHAGLFEHHW